MKIGVIKEGKIPPDRRVPLSPQQCKLINEQPGIELVVQKSDIRKFTDAQYVSEGIELVDSVADCDVLIGVKEVPEEQLIPNKKYLFFSHTFKEQPYNRKLLKTILEKNIQLIDWEAITNSRGQRLIAFGRYAGIVGTYNAFLGYGIKFSRYALKRAFECEDKKEMEGQLVNVDLPSGFKVVLTGKGRVGGGSIEVLEKIGIRRVDPKEFLTKDFEEPVYTQLGVEHYNKTKDGEKFDKQLFYQDPSEFDSDFLKYACEADMYVACHYWDSNAPYIFSREEAKDPGWKVSVIADISCDIDCAVASTIRPSTIASPFYGYDRVTEKEVNFMDKGAIGVMAVDNLPCELPKDASVDFGEMFIEHVLEPLKGNDPEDIIWRASETKNGTLTPHFNYLEDYVNGG